MVLQLRRAGTGVLLGILATWLVERRAHGMTSLEFHAALSLWQRFRTGLSKGRRAEKEIGSPSIRLSDRLRSLTWRDMVLALVTSAGFAGLWLRYGPSTQTVILSTYFGILLLIFVLDIEHRWVPNVLLFPASILALVVSALTGHPPLARSLVGGIAGFVWFYLMAIAYRGALGGGDVKLAGLIGLMTGFPSVLTALTLGIVIGGVSAALLLISGKTTCNSYIPYAPFLVTGAFLTLVFGTQIASRFSGVSGW